jgi:hypothetical protein
VSEHFPLIPLQHWLFTPELQWQFRGKWRILQGCQRETLGVGGASALSGWNQQEAASLFHLPPPNVYCVLCTVAIYLASVILNGLGVAMHALSRVTVGFVRSLLEYSRFTHAGTGRIACSQSMRAESSSSGRSSSRGTEGWVSSGMA